MKHLVTNFRVSVIRFYMGPSINYVSMAEGGGGGHQMLTHAHVGEGVYLQCLREHL